MADYLVQCVRCDRVEIWRHQQSCNYCGGNVFEYDPSNSSYATGIGDFSNGRYARDPPQAHSRRRSPSPQRYVPSRYDSSYWDPRGSGGGYGYSRQQDQYERQRRLEDARWLEDRARQERERVEREARYDIWREEQERIRMRQEYEEIQRWEAYQRRREYDAQQREQAVRRARAASEYDEDIVPPSPQGRLQQPGQHPGNLLLMYRNKTPEDVVVQGEHSEDNVASRGALPGGARRHNPARNANAEPVVDRSQGGDYQQSPTSGNYGAAAPRGFYWMPVQNGGFALVPLSQQQFRFQRRERHQRINKPRKTRQTPVTLKPYCWYEHEWGHVANFDCPEGVAFCVLEFDYCGDWEKNLSDQFPHAYPARPHFTYKSAMDAYHLNMMALAGDMHQRLEQRDSVLTWLAPWLEKRVSKQLYEQWLGLVMDTIRLDWTLVEEYAKKLLGYLWYQLWMPLMPQQDKRKRTGNSLDPAMQRDLESKVLERGSEQISSEEFDKTLDYFRKMAETHAHKQGLVDQKQRTIMQRFPESHADALVVKAFTLVTDMRMLMRAPDGIDHFDFDDNFLLKEMDLKATAAFWKAEYEKLP
jgi:hypothetical protein